MTTDNEAKTIRVGAVPGLVVRCAPVVLNGEPMVAVTNPDSNGFVECFTEAHTLTVMVTDLDMDLEDSVAQQRAGMWLQGWLRDPNRVGCDEKDIDWIRFTDIAGYAIQGIACPKALKWVVLKCAGLPPNI